MIDAFILKGKYHLFKVLVWAFIFIVGVRGNDIQKMWVIKG